MPTEKTCQSEEMSNATKRRSDEMSNATKC